jgi:hypothetical protein
MVPKAANLVNFERAGAKLSQKCPPALGAEIKS